jgi:hypothetical protein
MGGAGGLGGLAGGAGGLGGLAGDAGGLGSLAKGLGGAGSLAKGLGGLGGLAGGIGGAGGLGSAEGLQEAADAAKTFIGQGMKVEDGQNTGDLRKRFGMKQGGGARDEEGLSTESLVLGGTVVAILGAGAFKLAVDYLIPN